MRLGEIASITSGHNFRFAIDFDAAGNAYVIQMGNVEPGVAVDLQSVRKTNIQIVRKEPEWLRDNDIIFLARGAENFALHLPEIPANTVCTSHFFIIRVHNPHYLPGFIAWQLNQPLLQDYFRVARTGSVQQYITASVLKEAEILGADTELQNNLIYLNHLIMRERVLYSELLANRKQQLDELSHCIFNNANEEENP